MADVAIAAQDAPHPGCGIESGAAQRKHWLSMTPTPLSTAEALHAFSNLPFT